MTVAASTTMTVPETSGQILRRSGSNFYLSLFFLSRREREALTAIYAFARTIDDLVDESGSTDRKEQGLKDWREEVVRAARGGAESPLGNDLGRAIVAFNLSEVYFQELIDGVAMDLKQKRYETFEDLCRYCYGVAGTVGMICIELFNLRHARAQEYAILLGRAFQLTNILRDVATDVDEGRVYLPQEDLRRFGVSEGDLQAKVASPALGALIHFEAERAKRCYQEAFALLNRAETRKVIASRVMASIYFQILQKIINDPARVLRERVSVSLPEKLIFASRAWVACQFP